MPRHVSASNTLDIFYLQRSKLTPTCPVLFPLVCFMNKQSPRSITRSRRSTNAFVITCYLLFLARINLCFVSSIFCCIFIIIQRQSNKINPLISISFQGNCYVVVLISNQNKAGYQVNLFYIDDYIHVKATALNLVNSSHLCICR